MRPTRAIALLQPPTQYDPGLVRITVGEKIYYYVFREIPCEIGGRGFAVHRLGLANLYHVRISTPGDSTCECLGFLRHGRCKHVHGLRALVDHALL